jgi:hypothetical protein
MVLAVIAAIATIVAWRAFSYAAELEHEFQTGAREAALQTYLADLENRNRLLEDLLDARDAGSPSNDARAATSRERGFPGDERASPSRRQRPPQEPLCACAHCRYVAARAERLKAL